MALMRMWSSSSSLPLLMGLLGPSIAGGGGPASSLLLSTNGGMEASVSESTNGGKDELVEALESATNCGMSLLLSLLLSVSLSVLLP